MWTLSGFSDEIRPDFATQCRVVSDLGLKYVEIRSAWETNILDLDADQLATVQQTLAEHGCRSPASARRSARSRSTTTSRRTWTGCGTPPRSRSSFEAPYLRLFSFFIPDGRRSGRPSRRGARPDARDRRRRRAGRRDRCAREREGDLRRHPAPLPRHRRLGRLAESQAGLGSGELRAVRREAVHRGLRDAAPAHRLHPDQGRAVRRLLGGGGRGGRRRGRRDRSAPCATTASTGSSPSSRTWPRRTRLGGFSGAELWTQAHAAFTDILHNEGIEYA